MAPRAGARLRGSRPQCQLTLSTSQKARCSSDFRGDALAGVSVHTHSQGLHAATHPTPHPPRVCRLQRSQQRALFWARAPLCHTPASSAGSVHRARPPSCRVRRESAPAWGSRGSGRVGWGPRASPMLGGLPPEPERPVPSRRMPLTSLVLLLPGQVSEDLGGEKFCVDASQAGAGSWLKYIRVACSCDDQNLTMCQINEQVGVGLCPAAGLAASAPRRMGTGAEGKGPLTSATCLCQAPSCRGRGCSALGQAGPPGAR